MIEDSLDLQSSFAITALARALCRQRAIDADQLIRDFAEIAEKQSAFGIVSQGILKGMAEEVSATLQAKSN